MAKRSTPDPEPVSREWRTTEEIDKAIQKLERRIQELKSLDIARARYEHTGEDGVVLSNIRDTIRDVFGQNSPEFAEHRYIEFWSASA